MKSLTKAIFLGTLAIFFSCNKPDYGKLGAPDKKGNGKYDIENIKISKNIQLDSLKTPEDTNSLENKSNNFDGFYPTKINGKNYSLNKKISFKTNYGEYSVFGVLKVTENSDLKYEINEVLKKEKVSERKYKIGIYIIDKNLELSRWDNYEYTVKEGNSRDTQYISNTYLKRTEKEREILKKLNKENKMLFQEKENPEILKKEQPKINAYLEFIKNYKKIKD